MKKIFVVIFALMAAGCSQNQTAPTMPPIAPVASSSSADINQTPAQAPLPAGLALPISNALARVTKKPFGLYVSPGHSPVSPEKFTGYHTGADFETTPAEQNIDVPIYALCGGKLLLKKYASGYGGVAVQACVINGADVTVIYGHLRLSSIIPQTGQQLTAGQQIAVLGTGYTSETDGERKHLHLGIHKGTSVNILGYVQKQGDLSQWLNPLSLIK